LTPILNTKVVVLLDPDPLIPIWKVGTVSLAPLSYQEAKASLCGASTAALHKQVAQLAEQDRGEGTDSRPSMWRRQQAGGSQANWAVWHEVRRGLGCLG
jgi:hypothetical protein